MGHDPGDEDRTDSDVTYCANCGDPFDQDAEDSVMRQPIGVGTWRPCPNPAPGKPLVDCGIGGHMYTESKPRCD
jgi:hypothetical protein